MSPAGPRRSGQEPGNSASRALGKLRKLPGFTAAAVAFLLIVLLGGGGAAIAKWNQSATTTIAITAGAAPTSSPAPSPTPSPTPSATPAPSGPGNIVANPVIAQRPSTVNANNIGCTSPGNSGNFTFSWSGDPVTASGYNVLLKSLTASTAFAQTQNVTSKSALFVLENKPSGYGNYLLRIQPMNNGVAGDPVYRTLRYGGKDNWGCEYGSTDGQPPLGAFTASTAPVEPAPNDNQLKLSWTVAAQAANYVISIESKSTGAGATKAKYGAEFTTPSLAATLTFPPRVRDQWGNPVATADYFGQYTLRIIPMNGNQAGDPVYKTVQYQANDFTVWDG